MRTSEASPSGLITFADISTNTTSFTPRSAPFAFLQYEYLTRSKPLGGPQAGGIVDASNLTNPEPFGLDLNPKKPSYGGGEEEGRGLGAGGVIEIAAAVLVFVGGGFCRHRASNLQLANTLFRMVKSTTSSTAANTIRSTRTTSQQHRIVTPRCRSLSKSKRDCIFDRTWTVISGHASNSASE
ncbi:hypothetical protein BGZ91_011830 [Linnemannia elongata]|nr:hypothetical protein BGZ91_011830 [Linnemannia elongata]